MSTRWYSDVFTCVLNYTPRSHPNCVIIAHWLPVCDVDKHVSSIGCGTESRSLLDRSPWTFQSTSSLVLLTGPRTKCVSPQLKENQVLLKIKLHFEIVVCKHAAHANSKAKCLSSQDILPFVSCKSSFQLYSRFSWIFNPFLYNVLFCLTFLFFLLNFLQYRIRLVDNTWMFSNHDVKVLVVWSYMCTYTGKMRSWYVYNINANFFFNFAARGDVSNHEKNSLVNLF